MVQNTRKHKKFNWSAIITILIILGVSALVFLLSTKDFTSEINSQEIILLPDGSKVILAEDSKFQFNNWFWDFDRSTRLNGKAYFEVETGKTFSVKTPLGKVKVLGTRFEIKSRDSILKVVSYEGSVKVICNSDETELQKGQFVIYQNLKKLEQSNIYKDKPEWILAEDSL